MKKSLVVVCTFALASIGLAQLPPPGQDWVVESITRDGHTYGYSFGYVMGVPTPIPFDIPWGMETGGPQATNTTGIPFDVKATSEGRTVIRFRWNGFGNAPDRVMVERTSDVFGTYGQTGSAGAKNGLGHPMHANGPNTVVSQGVRKKIYNSSGGVFDVEIETFAEATGSQSAQVGQHIFVRVLPRYLAASIVGKEANYRKKLTGGTVSSWGGSYPKAIPELVLPEENESGEMHHTVEVGVPITTRAYYNYALPYTHIDATALAIGDHAPTETFQWHTPMDNTSGSLPGWGNDYTFGDAGVVNFFWACREDDNSITYNGLHTSADATITYTWNDGFTLTNRITTKAVFKHENPTKFHSINYSEDGQLTWQLASFGVLESDPSWTDVNQVSLQCTLRKKDAVITAAGNTLQFLFGVGAEFSPYPPAKLVCIAAGIGLNLIMPQDETQWFAESLDEFQASIARTPTEGAWVDEIPDEVTVETMREYQWRVRVLPLYKRDYYVADQYGDHGYEGQVEDVVKWQNSVRYGYEFQLRQGPGIQ